MADVVTDIEDPGGGAELEEGLLVDDNIEHVPTWQTPVAQKFWHIPQFCGSLIVSVHPVAQDAWPGGQQVHRREVARSKNTRPTSLLTIQVKSAARRWQPKWETSEDISDPGYAVSQLSIVQVAKASLQLR